MQAIQAIQEPSRLNREILFLDIGDILTIKDRTREGNDFDEYKLQLLERILNRTNFNIIWISSWIRNDSINVIDKYLEERGFKSFGRIIGPICGQEYIHLDKFQFDALKPKLISEYIKLFRPSKFLVIDSDFIKDQPNYLVIDGRGLDLKYTIDIIQKYKEGVYDRVYPQKEN